MIKADIINRVAEDARITKVKAVEAVEAAEIRPACRSNGEASKLRRTTGSSPSASPPRGERERRPRVASAPAAAEARI